MIRILLQLTLLLLFTVSANAQEEVLLGHPLMPGDTGITHKVTEYLPVFPFCDDFEDDQYREQMQCSHKKMMDFIYNILEYPIDVNTDAPVINVLISMIVERDGRLTSIKHKRRKNPVPQPMIDEALRIFDIIAKELPPWIPGYHNGEAVRVTQTMVVQFRRPK